MASYYQVFEKEVGTDKWLQSRNQRFPSYRAAEEFLEKFLGENDYFDGTREFAIRTFVDTKNSMAYGKNYGNNSYSRGGGGGYNGGRSYGNNGGGYNRQSQKKKSGCKVRENFRSRSGEVKSALATGWLKTRQGLISYVGSPAASKYQTTGNLKMVFKVKQGVSEGLYWGTFNPITKNVYIQGMNILGMPSRNSSFFRKNK